MRWDTAWPAARDVLLTGTGVFLILSQVFSVSPSDILLVTGLALTVPSVAGHAKTLLDGRTNGGSSRGSPPSGSPPSGSSPPEAAGEPTVP